MRDLIVVGFRGKHRAAEVLEELQALDEKWTIELDDAVAVYRTENGKLRIDQSVKPTTTQGAAIGGVLGALLGGLIASPFTAGASAAVAAATVGVGAVGLGSLGAAVGAIDAADWKAEYGIAEDFTKQVGGMVQPGDSAVFAVGKVWSDKVAERFRGYGGTVLRTTLSSAKAEKLQRTIAASN